jgi:hypothetical protein
MDAFKKYIFYELYIDNILQYYLQIIHISKLVYYAGDW